jgi:EAL domain-containing protein (putative c-di-GMP-specific phosphodiesterase class I)
VDERAVWRALFEGLDDAIVWCDRRDRILKANPAAQALLGHQAQRLRGRPLMHLLRPVLPPGTRSEADGPALPDGRYDLLAPSQARAADAAPLASHPRPIDLVRLATGDERRLGHFFILRVPGARAGAAHAHEQPSDGRVAELQPWLTEQTWRPAVENAMAAARHGGTLAVLQMAMPRLEPLRQSLKPADARRLDEVLAQRLKRGMGLPMVHPAAADVSRPLQAWRLEDGQMAMMLPELGDAEAAELRLRHLLDELAAPLVWQGQSLALEARVGVTLYPPPEGPTAPSAASDPEGLLHQASRALAELGQAGQPGWLVYRPDMDAALAQRLALEARLRTALSEHQFRLFYQPKARLNDGEVTSAEALLRWQSPQDGLVAPDRFIPVLEDTGLIVPVGAWVIREACAQMARWDACGLPRLSVAVNVSARQLKQPFLVALVRDSLAEAGIQPARLELELTESLMMDDTPGTRAVLDGLRGLGVSLAIDDFGTGHSSLSYLKRLDVDTLKIDRAFVKGLPQDTEDAAIATAILAMAHSLKMAVVAEGVETQAQADFLKARGCEWMQGWLLGRPMPPEDLIAWLKSYRRRAQTGVRSVDEASPSLALDGEPAHTHA